jgi:hypothetical protein
VEQELLSLPQHPQFIVEQELLSLPEHPQFLVEQELLSLPEHPQFLVEQDKSKYFLLISSRCPNPLSGSIINLFCMGFFLCIFALLINEMCKKSLKIPKR